MIMVVDIETSGPSVIKNGILSIGYCLGDMNGNIHEKKRIDVHIGDKIFDPYCKTNFWDKSGPKEVLLALQKAPMAPKDAIQKFMNRVDEFDHNYALMIMSDNPSFDLYFINYYIDIYMDRKPINYQFGKTYRPIMDFNSFSKGRFGPMYRKHMHIDSLGKHDHYPDNDAEYIFRCFVQYQ